ncbi:hypothetical protein GCM10010910_03540 [Microbacterium nanhaiense]|uniref:DUF3515 domain-containing protein n=1 Tax=Microbacterium nanhaiense TaxID=1301026 RepID=A0ABQ2MW15_9MICO|nr:DUF3515 family protein [Microbacterium nanhaiense]GGO59769.1 hypothetical protein GCM10010910_03540 [Microbacterium nanhaiense]
MKTGTRTTGAAVALLALAAALTACADTVPLTPAPGANEVECAAASVRLPNAIGEQTRRWTNAQATGAWGDPTAVTFTCGTDPVASDDKQCVRIGGVDWTVDESRSPQLTLATFGRNPAAEVVVDTTVLSADDVLDRLAVVAQQLPSTGQCTEADVREGANADEGSSS